MPMYQTRLARTSDGDELYRRGVYDARSLDPRTGRRVFLLVDASHRLITSLVFMPGESEVDAAGRAWALLDLLDPPRR